MIKHRTFGTWLVNYSGTDRISDLRDDFMRDLRNEGLKARQFKTPFDLYHHIHCIACGEALETLHEAAKAYGKPLPDQKELERMSYIRDVHLEYANDPERRNHLLSLL